MTLDLDWSSLSYRNDVYYELFECKTMKLLQLLSLSQGHSFTYSIDAPQSFITELWTLTRTVTKISSV